MAYSEGVVADGAGTGKRGRGRSPEDNRNIINGILGRLRTGARWHDVPEKSGNWHSIYRRFRRWSTLGDADFLRKRRRRPQRRHCHSGYSGRYRR